VKKARGATQREEPLSSEDASYGDVADRVPAQEAYKVTAEEGVAVWSKGIFTVGSWRGKARQKPRSTNTEDRDEFTIFRMTTVPTQQLNRECNTTEQGHQVNYFTNSPKLATMC